MRSSRFSVIIRIQISCSPVRKGGIREALHGMLKLVEFGASREIRRGAETAT